MAVRYRRLPSISIQEQERFWARVSKEPGQGPNGDCWQWQGYRIKAGYGTFYIRAETYPQKAGQGHTHFTNRIAYFLQTGDDPFGFHVMHSCDNPACVRGDHLSKGTPKENTLDAKAKGRLATGDRAGSRTKPESRHRGNAHWTHRIPEKVYRPNGKPPLTHDDIRAIRAAVGTQKEIAKRFGVCQMTVSNLKRRATRAEVE